RIATRVVCMPTVVREGNISIRVHREGGEPHHWPHCHVEWPDGATSIRIPQGEIIIGTPLPRRVVEVVERTYNGCDRGRMEQVESAEPGALKRPEWDERAYRRLVPAATRTEALPSHSRTAILCRCPRRRSFSETRRV